MEQSFGLVLRTYYGRSYKIALLDKMHGRFDALITTQMSSICNGAIVRYSFATPVGVIPRLVNIEQIQVPFEWASVGLEFIHHILEICLYCIPIGTTAPEALDILIATLYTVVPHACTDQIKKIIILKILISIGIISDQINIYYMHIELCLTTPLDKIGSIIDRVDGHILDELIMSCLQTYLPITQLRTMTALLELRKI